MRDRHKQMFINTILLNKGYGAMEAAKLMDAAACCYVIRQYYFRWRNVK